MVLHFTKPVITEEDKSKKKIWLWIEYIINILNAFVLTATIGVFAFKNLALAFPFMFPGNEFALPDWFAGSLYSPMCGALAVMEGVTALFALAQIYNGLKILRNFEYSVDDLSILKFKLWSAAFTFFGSSAICVGASLIVFGVVSTNIAFMVFVPAFAIMALSAIFTYLADAKNVGDDNKTKTWNKVKPWFTCGLYVFGIVALSAKLSTAVSVVATITVAGGWTIAGLLGGMVVVGFIILCIYKWIDYKNRVIPQPYPVVDGKLTLPLSPGVISWDCNQTSESSWYRRLAPGNYTKVTYLPNDIVFKALSNAYNDAAKSNSDLLITELQNDPCLEVLIKGKELDVFQLQNNIIKFRNQVTNSPGLPENMKKILLEKMKDNQEGVFTTNEAQELQDCLKRLDDLLIDKGVIIIESSAAVGQYTDPFLHNL
jgi:hypothetical protein